MTTKIGLLCELTASGEGHWLRFQQGAVHDRELPIQGHGHVEGRRVPREFTLELLEGMSQVLTILFITFQFHRRSLRKVVKWSAEV